MQKDIPPIDTETKKEETIYDVYWCFSRSVSYCGGIAEKSKQEYYFLRYMHIFARDSHYGDDNIVKDTVNERCR